MQVTVRHDWRGLRIVPHEPITAENVREQLDALLEAAGSNRSSAHPPPEIECDLEFATALNATLGEDRRSEPWAVGTRHDYCGYPLQVTSA